jgi:hypothetical protein
MAKCPCCSQTEGKSFFKVENSPVHSTVLLYSRQEALRFPAGDISLQYCTNCGLIYNSRFDKDLVNYSQESECWQGYSTVFNSFNSELVKSLVDDFDIKNKFVIEIGSGSGDFLNQLCIVGNNEGTGFDPAYNDEKQSTAAERVKFIKDYYSDKYSELQADAYFCLMTLEHIYNPKKLITDIRKSMHNTDSRLFIQVPNMTQILDESRFWDIYYEHCNYFTRESLLNFLSINGFGVEKIWTVFGDQYMIAIANSSAVSGPVVDQGRIYEKTERFDEQCQLLINRWKKKLARLDKPGNSVVLWGSGSKATGFIQATRSAKNIDSIVDINPKKQGKYLPGFGHKIVAPDYLKSIFPRLIIILNPIYENEIIEVTRELGIKADITMLSG